MHWVYFVESHCMDIHTYVVWLMCDDYDHDNWVCWIVLITNVWWLWSRWWNVANDVNCWCVINCNHDDLCDMDDVDYWCEIWMGDIVHASQFYLYDIMYFLYVWESHPFCLNVTLRW